VASERLVHHRPDCAEPAAGHRRSEDPERRLGPLDELGQVGPAPGRDLAPGSHPTVAGDLELDEQAGDLVVAATARQAVGAPEGEPVPVNGDPRDQGIGIGEHH